MRRSEDAPKQRGIETVAIHAGEAPDPVTGASAPNLVMSTTFTVDEPISFSANEQPDEAPFVYTRWGNPTLRQLEEKLAALEGAEAGAVFASGMGATSALLLSRLSAGDRLVVSDTNYAGVAELCRDTLPRLGIDVEPVDTSDLDAVASALAAGCDLVLIETPANPILRLADIQAIATMSHNAGAELVVDSTFATPIATRPIELGADYVIHSLTKYIGGHGDAVGGAVLGSRDGIASLRTEATVHYGGVLSPFNAWLIMRGVATLPIRMQAHEAAATRIAQHLEAHPRVERVTYPGLDSHPQRELAKRQMANMSGMLTFQVDRGDTVAKRMMAELEIIHYAVSLGHHRSLIYWMPTDELIASSYRIGGPQLSSYQAYAGDGIFRLSVGLETPDDLIEDLDRVLG